MKLFLILYFFTMTLMAVEESSQRLDVHTMIQEIQEASDADRFEKMNAFKKYLRALNAQERKAAIVKLQSSLQKKNSEDSAKQKQEHVKKNMHLQESQQQLQMQHQNQNKMGSSGAGGSGTRRP